MSDILSDLTAATTPLAGADQAYVVQGGNSRKTTVADYRGEAADLPYDNGASGLTATDTQAAIDETAALVAGSLDVASAIHAASNKATPVDNDELGIADSAASYVLKHLLWSNVKATLKTYFDTLYATVAGSVATNRQVISGGGLTGGGDLSADRTLVVGAGTGIDVNADDVQITAAYQAIGKQTIWVPASAMLAATTNGPASAQVESTTNKVNIAVLDFDATTAEQAWFSVAFPKGWNEGTVSFQVFWFSTATDTDGMATSLAGVAFSDNETLDTAVGTPVVVTDDAQSASTELYVSAESSAVTIAGSPAEGDLCMFRVQRVVSDGNDDMAEDMRLVGIKLFYTTNAANDA